jgi:hypothetical protein
LTRCRKAGFTLLKIEASSTSTTGDKIIDMRTTFDTVRITIRFRIETIIQLIETETAIS